MLSYDRYFLVLKKYVHSLRNRLIEREFKYTVKVIYDLAYSRAVNTQGTVINGIHSDLA